MAEIGSMAGGDNSWTLLFLIYNVYTIYAVIIFNKYKYIRKNICNFTINRDHSNKN